MVTAGWAKPNLKAFERLLEDTDPSKVGFIGDTYSKEIEPSEKLGLGAAVLINPTKEEKMESTKIRTAQVNEFKNIRTLF